MDLRQKSPEKEPSDPPSRLPTRGRTSVELSKVPPSRERQQLLDKATPQPVPVATGQRRGGKGSANSSEKIIIPSKYGYHTRSNSATYKRLNKARTKMDQIIETQVVEFTAKSELPDILNHFASPEHRYTPGNAISISRERSHLYFNIDPGVYDYFKEKKDLKKLYKSSIKSGKSNCSMGSNSSGKSLTIVLPKVDPDSSSNQITERSTRDKAATNPHALDSQASLSKQSNAVDVASASDDKLPGIRRSVTFDSSVPSSPKKKSRRGRKSQLAATEANVDDVSFLVGDSKSLTPSPSKTKRSQRLTSIGSVKSNNSNEQLKTAISAPNLCLKDNHISPSADRSHNASPQKQRKDMSRGSSRFSEKLQDYETSYMQISEAKEKLEATTARVVISPPVFDSDEEFNDEFENI